MYLFKYNVQYILSATVSVTELWDALVQSKRKEAHCIEAVGEFSRRVVVYSAI